MAWSTDNQGREYSIDESVIKPLSPLAEAIERCSVEDFCLFVIALARLEKERNGTSEG